MITRLRGPRGFGGFVSVKQTLEAKLSGDCVCRELKVATGEWFLEERSKRFEQGVPSSDAIKQTIMSIPCCEFGSWSQQPPSLVF